MTDTNKIVKLPPLVDHKLKLAPKLKERELIVSIICNVMEVSMKLNENILTGTMGREEIAKGVADLSLSLAGVARPIHAGELMKLYKSKPMQTEIKRLEGERDEHDKRHQEGGESEGLPSHARGEGCGKEISTIGQGEGCGKEKEQRTPKDA